MLQQNQFPFSEKVQESNGGNLIGGLLIIIGIILTTVAVNYFAQKDPFKVN
jgi:hypothetical protein